jgi:FkbM family methyltransferase
MDKSLKKRIEITTGCKDCDYIPKAHNAGEVIYDGDSKTWQIMHNGIKVFTDSHYGDFNTEIIKRLKGHHEPQEEKVFYEILKLIPPNSTMIELGSFWAYYSMWFNKEIRGAKNYMIEPMPEILEKGKLNFALNDLNRGDFTQACVGARSCQIVRFQHWDGTYHYVPQICIDDFIATNGIDFVHILHADIEGAEHEMLKGAQNSITNRKIEYIFVSTHSEVIHLLCLNFLLDNNQLIIAEHQPAESYSVDGLIVSCSNPKSFITVNISRRNIAMAALKRVIAKILLRLNRNKYPSSPFYCA